MAKLKELRIDDKTLVVFLNDNGGTGGGFNAGMRGMKCTAFNGGTRAMALWRWPGVIQPAACDKLTAHLDFFPTFAELTGAKVPAEVAKMLDGFSLVPLLENPQAGWHDERMLFTHVGRWNTGVEPQKYAQCSVRWKQYLQVWENGQWCLYDLKVDPAEKNNIAAQQQEVLAKLDKAYDAWWEDVLPCLENEQAYKTAPKANPFKEQYERQAILGLPDSHSGAVIPVTDANVLKGLSPYNWVCRADSISTTVNGASAALKFKGTRQVAMQVTTDNLTTKVPGRFPIIAWSVNGGVAQTHQIVANEAPVVLSSGVADPRIELYLKGMSPFEDSFSGDVPGNALKITGFAVDAGGSITPTALPDKVWLNIGDSIMSGDGAAYAKGQGRPPDDAWAASEDGRASYGYLLAKQFGYREARIAYGGYNWGGGMAGVPALDTLIDQRTSTVSRLVGTKLSPSPAVVLVNLGENGAPAAAAVTQALVKLRSRVSQATTILVMIPISGQARAEVTQAFNTYIDSSKDGNAHLIDLKQVAFDTCDGQHPTAAGHLKIYQTALPLLEKTLGRTAQIPDKNPGAQSFWRGKGMARPGAFASSCPQPKFNPMPASQVVRSDSQL
jgi:hypothetical protein